MRVPRASTRSSSGSGARPSRKDAGRLSGVRPPLRHSIRRGRGSARLAWTERRARLEPSLRGSIPAFRSVGADRGGGFREPAGDPRRCARCRDRGSDAQAPRFALCRGASRRALVQMEARSAHRRLRDDVCPARHGKRSSFYSDYTFGCWTAPPEEGGELLPVGKAYSGFTDEELEVARPVRAQPAPSSASARCARSRRRWCWRWRSIRSTHRSATNRGWRCASPASRASAATSPRTRPI
jgi:hypothetical protein